MGLAGRGSGGFRALDDNLHMPAMTAGRQDGSRGNVAQIDAGAAANVRGRDSVAFNIYPADIVRPGQIGITSACFVTYDSAVYWIPGLAPAYDGAIKPNETNRVAIPTLSSLPVIAPIPDNRDNLMRFHYQR